MPETYWAAIDTDRDNETTSGWLKKAAEHFLAGRGVKVEDPRHILVARFLALVDAQGPEVIHAKLEELSKEAAVAAAASP